MLHMHPKWKGRTDMGHGYYHKVEICGVDTSKLKTLTPEEKAALLLRSSKGDRAARQALIDGNLRLVLSIVQRFSGRGENMDDLFQVGCIGLIKAIDRFDVSTGVQLSTYAVPMIIGELRRYLRDNNAIRVSRGTRDLAYRAMQAKEALTASLSREPTMEELAASVGASPAAVGRALEAISDPVSLYEPIYNDGADSVYVMDQIGDTENTDETWLESIALRQALDTLSPRERRIIEMRFFANRTQMEIAAEIGISQAQVSRLEKGALARMRKQM